MTASIQKDRHGPDWPLGFIGVATPGTPVNIMSVVDPANLNDPVGTAATAGTDEYTVRCQQIMIQGMKPGAAHGTQNNTGNIYLVRQKVGSGSGNRDDTGSIVLTIAAGQTFFYSSAPLNRNVFNPYRYSIDADNANDGAFVTLIIQ